MTSAADATFAALSASRILQSAGTGTTTFGGAADTNGALGVSVLAGNVTVSGSVTASGGGAVSLQTAALGTIASSGTISNGGAGTAISLRSDSMALGGGTIAGGSGTVSLGTVTAGRAITLGTGATGLGLGDAELDTISTSGTLLIGGAAHTGTISTDGAVTQAGVTGLLELLTNGASITLGNPFGTAGDLTLDTRGGVAVTGTVSGTGALTVGGGGAGSLTIRASTGINLTSVANQAQVVLLDNGTSGNVVYNNNRNMTLGASANAAAGGSLSVANGTGTLATGGNLYATGIVLQTAGAMTLGHDLDAGAGTLRLTPGAGVTQSAGAITAAGLLLDGTGTHQVEGAGNNVATVAAATTGAVSYVDADAVTIGTVSGVDGIATGGSAATVRVATGGAGNTLTVSQPIATGGGDITLGTAGAPGASIVLGLGLDSGGGNILLEDPVLLSGSMSWVSGAGTIGTSYGVTDGIGSHTLTVNDAASTGTATFNGAVEVNALATSAGAYAVRLYGSGTVIDTATTFLNTGGVSLGNDPADLLRFPLGLVSTAGTTTLDGVVQAAGTPIEIGTTALGGNSVLDTTDAGAVSTGADITIGDVNMATYLLSLITGSTGSLVSSGTISGTSLCLDVGGNIDLDTAVDNLAARAGGYIDVRELDAVTVASLCVNGLDSGSNGYISLVAGGTITLSAPVAADGTGAVTLDAGTGGVLTSALVSSGSGAVTITADTVTLGAGVSSTGGALVIQPFTAGRLVSIGAVGTEFDLQGVEIGELVDGFSSITVGRSTSGEVTVTSATFTEPVTVLGGGLVRVIGLATSQAGAAVTVIGGAGVDVGVVEAAGNGPITITAGGGSITEVADPSRLGAVGSTSVLELTASGGIGAAGAGAIDTDVGVLRVTAGGAVYLSEANALELGDGTGDVSSSGGSMTIVSAGAISTGNGIATTGGDWSISLSSTAGGLGIGTGHPVTASGNGAVALSSTGAGAGLTVSALVSSAGSGAISLSSGGAFLLADAVTVSSGSGDISITTTGGSLTVNGTAATSGAVSVTSSAGVVMDATSLLQGGAAGVSILAATSVVADVVESTANGPITITAGGGTITEAAQPGRLGAAGSTSVLDLTAAGGIGAAGAGAMDTDVGVLRVSAGGDVYILEAGAVQLGDAGVGNDVTTTGSLFVSSVGAMSTGNAVGSTGPGGDVLLTTTGGGTITLSNPVSTTGGDITVGTAGAPGANIVVGGNLSSGGGAIVLEDPVVLSASVSWVSGAGAIGTSYGVTDGVASHTLSLQDASSTGTVTFGGAVTVNGLAPAAGGYSVLLAETGTVIDTATTFLNTGGVYLGDAAADVLVFSGGVTSTAGATEVHGTVRSGGAPIALGGVTLAGNTVLDTTLNGTVGTGAAIQTGAIALDAAGHTLGLRAGTTGDVTIGGSLAGALARSGAVTITSARDVDLQAVTAASLAQLDGSGTTTLSGAVDTDGAPGVSLAGAAFAVNAAVGTSGGGPVTIANTGLLTIAAGANMTLDGPFTQSGPGAVSTAGNITTTNDAVSFAGGVTLTGPVLITTAGAAVTFSGTLDGTEDLTLTAGAGTVTFDGVVGGGTGLGTLTVASAGAVNVNQALTTTAGRDVLIASSGLLSIAAGANIAAGGSFSQTGAGDVVTSGDITAVSGIGWSSRVYPAGNVSWDPGAGFEILNLGGFDLHLWIPGFTLQLLGPLTCRNLVFYDGTLNLNGNDLTTVGDLVLFGAAYNADDTATGVAGIYAYEHPARTGSAELADPSVSAPPAGNPRGIPAPAAATVGALNGLNGATLTVGRNFYDNGCDLSAAGWTLELQADVRDASVAFAEAYNATVSGSTVVSAFGAQVAAGNEGCVVTDPGWDATPPVFVAGQSATVYDNVIRVRSSEPIENSNDDINSVISELYFDDGGSVAFTEAFTDPECTVSTSTVASDLDEFYLKTTLRTWSTDATGTGAGPATSTDRSGLDNRTAVPSVGFVRDSATVYFTLRDANKNRFAAALTVHTDVSDGCAPVLVAVVAGKDAPGDRSLPVDQDFDGHNYLELTYSEPVTIDGLGTTESNVRAASGAAPWGDLTSAGATATLARYLSYDGTITRGSTDGNDATNAFYRDPLTPQTVRVYIVGYRDVSGAWPGWMEGVTSPVGRTVTAAVNAGITDAASNVLEPGSVGVYPEIAPVVAAAGTGWDVFAPGFARYSLRGSRRLRDRHQGLGRERPAGRHRVPRARRRWSNPCLVERGPSRPRGRASGLQRLRDQCGDRRVGGRRDSGHGRELGVRHRGEQRPVRSGEPAGRSVLRPFPRRGRARLAGDHRPPGHVHQGERRLHRPCRQQDAGLHRHAGPRVDAATDRVHRGRRGSATGVRAVHGARAAHRRRAHGDRGGRLRDRRQPALQPRRARLRRAERRDTGPGCLEVFPLGRCTSCWTGTSRRRPRWGRRCARPRSCP